MANITTLWDDDAQTIMRVTYQRGWSWDDLEGNLPLEATMLDSVSHTVDVIADFRDTQLPPGAISRLPRIAQSPPYTHRNAGMMVMVATPGFITQVVEVYKRVYGQANKLIVVQNLEDARRLIARKRAAQAQEKAEPPAN